jgi:hypothetical protein
METAVVDFGNPDVTVFDWVVVVGSAGRVESAISGAWGISCL